MTSPTTQPYHPERLSGENTHEPGVAAPARGAGVAIGLVKSARPKQWLKNGFVVVPALFGAALLKSWVPVLLAMIGFCFVSSSLYLLNDVLDRESDRLHERTRHRPIAAGIVPVPAALVTSMVLLVVGLGLSWLAAPATLLLVAIYAASTLAYSMGLKRVVILDVLILAAGFVLRMLAGAAAAHIPATVWLLLCMMFLALFLGFGKRRYDLITLGQEGKEHRKVLSEYTPELLTQFLLASLVCTLLCYSLYVFLSPAGMAHQGFMLTIPFAVFGIFRYLLVAETRASGGSPEDLLVGDRPLLIAAGCWIVVALLSVYVLPAKLF